MKKEFEDCGHNGRDKHGCVYDHAHEERAQSHHHCNHEHEGHHHDHNHVHGHGGHGHGHSHGFGMSPKSLIAAGVLFVAFSGATRLFISNDIETYRDEAIEQLVTAELENQKYQQSVNIQFSKQDVDTKTKELFEIAQDSRNGGAATFAVLGVLAASVGGIGMAVKRRKNSRKSSTPKPGV